VLKGKENPASRVDSLFREEAYKIVSVLKGKENPASRFSPRARVCGTNMSNIAIAETEKPERYHCRTYRCRILDILTVTITHFSTSTLERSKDGFSRILSRGLVLGIL
jgi:hypothetical protein